LEIVKSVSVERDREGGRTYVEVEEEVEEASEELDEDSVVGSTVVVGSAEVVVVL
jgi:hypothetical protein